MKVCWDKIGLFAGGVLLGSYGIKLLGSSDAKKAYTHTTAAVLRMKDEVVKDFTVLKENAGDVYAEAQDINEKRRQAYEAQQIEDARALLAEAEARAGASVMETAIPAKASAEVRRLFR